jgi:hypothetical protein
VTELGLLKEVLDHLVRVLLEPQLGCSELWLPFLDESLVFLDGQDCLVCAVVESLNKCMLAPADRLFLGNWLRDGLLVLGWGFLAQALKVSLLNLFLIGETALLGNCAVLILIIEHGLGRGAP